MTKIKNDVERRMLINRTINSMDKMIDKLEQKKQCYIEAGKNAKLQGLTSQYQFAIKALKITLVQQKRVQEMKLNFEITSQMNEMFEMTGEFLNGMSMLSKDMAMLTNAKNFGKVEKQFSEAMHAAQMQADSLGEFMKVTQSTIEQALPELDEDDLLAESLISGDQSEALADTDSDIEEELNKLRKQMTH